MTDFRTNHCQWFIAIFLIHTLNVVARVEEEVPVIVTEASLVEVAERHPASLHCLVRNLGRNSVVWQRGKRVLTAKHQVIDTDKRLRILTNYTLQLSDTTRRDAGQYTCSVSTKPVTQVTHTLAVLYGPQVSVDAVSGIFTTSMGSNTSVKCLATGNPAPTIFWQKVDGFLPDGRMRNYGAILEAYNVRRQMAGEYQCVAENGIGPAVSKKLMFRVQYAPEISAVSKRVFSGVGRPARISCLVDAYPETVVTWTSDRSDRDLPDHVPGSNWRVLLSGDRKNYTLEVNDLAPEDFGTYTCRAENRLGVAHAKVIVSGTPESPSVLPSSGALSPDRYLLQWQVKSFSPITEFRVGYKNNQSTESDKQVEDVSQEAGGVSRKEAGGVSKKEGGKVSWKEVEVPAKGSATNISDIYRQTIILSPLQPNSAYQVVVSACNLHGCGGRSIIHHFTTAARGEVLESRHPTTHSSSVTLHGCQTLPVLAALVALTHV